LTQRQGREEKKTNQQREWLKIAEKNEKKMEGAFFET
jgi:hypothetical protein